MEIKRGYVKWEENGKRFKEPLYKHPKLYAEATPEQKAAADEVRKLNDDEPAQLELVEVDLYGPEDDA